ncbi:MAG: hypothetical protein RL750_545 [Bacteroidota bacterium]
MYKLFEPEIKQIGSLEQNVKSPAMPLIHSCLQSTLRKAPINGKFGRCMRSNMMNRIFIGLVFCVFSGSALAQRTAVDTDPRRQWDQAVQWFYEGKESLAYPIFLQHHRERGRFIDPLVPMEEVDFFRLACGVRLDEESAVDAADRYVQDMNPPAYEQALSYYLADHHFRFQRFAEAEPFLDLIDARNLKQPEQIHFRFMNGYTHFIAQRFDRAQPFFDSVRTQVGHADYAPANYYYGFLCLRKMDYEAALASLRLVEDHPDYRSLVPYYIGQLYYLQGKKAEAIRYVENKLADASAQYYELPLKQLLGHAYFERRDFEKALPLLKEYVSRSPKVRREDLYELSYCYHQSGQFQSSIPGFRELAGGQDSLSQHAMYLLGDAYLKTGDLTSARTAFQFCARNNSYRAQREVSLLQFSKLSYELAFLTDAQQNVELFLIDYPNSTYKEEAQELMVMVLSATNNYRQALEWLNRIESPSSALKKSFPRIWFGRAMELINDQQFGPAQDLLAKVFIDPASGTWKPQALFWSGEIAYRQNDYSVAINRLLEYVNTSKEPVGEANAVNARYTLGYAYLKSANYAAAGDQFQQLTKNLPTQPSSLLQDAWLRAGDCFYMRREYNKAKPFYERATSLSWGAADYAQYQLAMIAGIRNLGEKIRLLQIIPSDYPSSNLLPDTYLEMANAYVADRKFREAIPALDRVIGAATQDSWISRALLMQGICWYNLDNYESALGKLKEVVKRFPNGEDADDALENIRQVYAEMGQSDQYISYRAQIGKPLEYPVADSLTFASAEHYYANGQEQEALAASERYIRQYPNGQHRLKAFYQLADLFIKRRQWTESLVYIDSVVSRAPNKYEEWCWREGGRIAYFEKKDPALALRYYNGLLAVTRNQEWRMEALRGSVRCHHQLNDWVAGSTQAKLLLNERNTTPDDRSIAYLLIAKQAMKEQKWNESLDAFRSVLTHNKGSFAAESRYQIAWIQFQMGNTKEAEKGAEETIRRSGSFEPWVTKSYLLLGDVYLQQKDYFNAKATFQSVMDNTEVMELKEEARTKLQRVVEEERKSTKLDS